MKDIVGKNVLITGGAAGIGAAIALEFERAGACVIVTDLAKKPSKNSDASAHIYYQMDVTDSKSIQNARRLILRDVGPIDILVNNAGTVFGGPFLSTPLEKHLNTFNINLAGATSVTHAFLTDLLGNRGSLVFISSASGFIGLPNGAAYAASKWGLIGLAESLRLEMKPFGVDVTIVCPSYVNTGLFSGARPPMLTAMLTPETVAVQTVLAVRNRKVYLKIPGSVSLIGILRSLLPLSFFDFVLKKLSVADSMTGWKGRSR